MPLSKNNNDYGDNVISYSNTRFCVSFHLKLSIIVKPISFFHNTSFMAVFSLCRLDALRAFLLCMAAFCCAVAFPLPADFYASSSRLASGNWAKIEVAESGMQFISNTTLRNLGFSDPEKVNVYGFGGRGLPELLNGSMSDDLPLVPSLRTPSGIVFFGHATVGWAASASNNMKYRHSLNAYSDKAYYFISDCDGNHIQPSSRNVLSADNSDVITSFTERIVHEQDLMAPSNTGRLILGEDFRVQSTRSFPFSLPGNIGDVSLLVRFGAKVQNGSSSLVMSANGETLSATQSDKIAGVTNSDTFIAVTNSYKKVSNPGEKLNLSIRYSNTGALFTAALDYIEIEYQRELKILDGELYFYINPAVSTSVRIENCSSSTVIWDVSVPEQPLVVDYELSGTTASFAAPAGYREYVAFNPAESRRSVSPAGKIANQDLHAMEAPDMLIITPDIFRSAAMRVAQMHADIDGMNVAVLSPETIYNEFSSGVPDVTAFRKLLKMWFDRAGGNPDGYPNYCLIFSRPTYDNKMVTQTVKRDGYPRIPIWQSSTGSSISTSYSTDDYIGMLDDNPNALSMRSAAINVAVGRMPVKTIAEANSAVEKLENYVRNPKHGAWRNNIMVIADDQDNADHLIQAEKVITEMRKYGKGDDYIYEKLYLDAYPLSMSATGASYPLAKKRMLDKISEGVLFINYIGHANPREWGHEKLLTWSDITEMSNANLPFLFAATCEFLCWDDDVVSGGEEMWLNPEAGVIGMICPSRKVYISLNGNLNANTAPFVFGGDPAGGGTRIGDIMVSGKNATPDDDNKLRFALMGDPAMRLPSPVLNVVVDNIDGKLTGNSDELPVLRARSKVKVAGHIADMDGGVLSDFNGVADISLYDAEKVVQTYGNGEFGVVKDYNDRKTRLFIGKANVVNGYWETEIMIPSEIENNFSPALLAIYASDDDGREANGGTDDFYVFGYNEDADDDFDGPAISDFYINSPSFVDGSSVSPYSIVYASFSDATGINVSDTGIGHDLVITLDGKQRFDDVMLHYTPGDSFEYGSIAYPIKDIEPGEHSISLTVWDNANNSSTETLSFSVMAGWKPTITRLEPDANPASSSVNFTVATDGVSGKTSCRMEIYDLSGRLLWDNDSAMISASSAATVVAWDLKDSSGRRVPRGIYIYKASVVTQEGAEISKSGKIAVTAP